MISDRVQHWASGQGLELIQKWVRDGLSEKEIIQKVGVHPVTWRKWKNVSPAIYNALHQKPDNADALIEKALLKRASGYTVDIAKTYKLKRIEYKDGKKVREFEELAQGVDQLHVPADLSAQIFWLKNRRPKCWKEKPNPDPENDALQKLDAVLEDWKEDWKDDAKPKTD